MKAISKWIGIIVLFAVPALAIQFVDANGGVASKVIVTPGTAGTAPAVSVLLTISPPTTGTAATYNLYRTLSSNGCAGVGGGVTPPTGCAPIGSTPGSTSSTTFTDTTVTWSTTYYWVATSVGSPCPTGKVCESGASPQATATTGPNPTPGPPSGLTASSTTANNVQLQWKAPSEPVYAYRAYRKLTTVAAYSLVKAGITATSYKDTSVPAGKYDYEVRAVALDGRELSVASNQAQVTVK